MSIIVQPLAEKDLDAADRIFRLAFGTFLGLPDPMQFAGDADYVHGRWRADPEAALGAYRDGELVASNFVTLWGSFGFFGPLSVHPDLWDGGVAQRLLEPTIEIFERRGTRLQGLFTFPQSTKHVALYQKFGFYPRFLTPVMTKPVSGRSREPGARSLSAVAAADREAALRACREVAETIEEGLDLSREIRVAETQRLGDTILVEAGDRLEGFAVCHLGAGTEAGTGSCYVKFGAVRPGPHGEEHLDRLLRACEAMAAARGAERLIVGVNAERERTYERLRGRGFRAALQGVAMQRPNVPGFNRRDALVIDDWR